MYLNDFKPYLYMTNDYGQHWTLLTDGTNGIPADEPMHVVREDPEQEGLLYAGTLQAAYVSFDQGKHWQTLQQNLPATPVTDLKVHHGDLLASTMGRSFWIMDNIAPLRQIAASVTKSTRPRSTDNPNGQSASTGQPASAGQGDIVGHRFSGAARGTAAADVVLAAMQTPAAAAKRVATTPASPGAATRVQIKPFDPSGVFLFTPAPTYRVRYQVSAGRPDLPEYPAAGARIDYFLPGPTADLKPDILDPPAYRAAGARIDYSLPGTTADLTLAILYPAGTVVRSFSSAAPAAAAAGGRGGRRGGNLPSTLPTRTGMNRFVWDLRYAGGPAATGSDTEGGGGGGGGPLVAPGTYKARLTAGGVTRTESLTVKIDPRIAKDGITAADLAEQTKFSLKVRDALAEARQLSQRVRQAIEAKRGDAGRLQGISERLVTKSGPYEDQMLIDQLSNVSREVGQADQKIGASAYERFNQLMKEWTSLKADAESALR